MIRRLLHLYHSRLLAELRFLLPTFFLFFLVLNLATKTSFDFAKDNVLDEPQNVSRHQDLGKLLLADNQLAAAKKEFFLARDSQNIEKVSLLEAEPEEIKNRITFWQKISAVFPNYRDAYLKLAILNYKLGRDFDTQKFLDRALEIDPNNDVAKQLVLK